MGNFTHSFVHFDSLRGPIIRNFCNYFDTIKANFTLFDYFSPSLALICEFDEHIDQISKSL